MLDTRRPRDIQTQRGFTQRRSGCEDHQLSGVQTVGERIQIGETGRHADHLTAAIGDRLDLGECAIHQVTQRQVILCTASLGDLVHLGLRTVDHIVDLTLAGVPHLHDARSRLDQAAQDRPLAHDARVVLRVRRGRHHRHQGVQIRRAPDAGQLTDLGQLMGDRDRIGRLAFAVQVEDRAVDGGVGRTVEVGLADHLDDIGDRILAQHHRPEHRLLRGDVLRRGTVGALIGGGQFGDAHMDGFTRALRHPSNPPVDKDVDGWGNTPRGQGVSWG